MRRSWYVPGNHVPMVIGKHSVICVLFWTYIGQMEIKIQILYFLHN